MNPEYTPAGWSPLFAETTAESPWQQCFKRELTGDDAANVQLDEPPLAIWQTLLEPTTVSEMSSPFAWVTEGMAYRCLLSQQQDAPHAELITVCEESTKGGRDRDASRVASGVGTLGANPTATGPSVSRFCEERPGVWRVIPMVAGKGPDWRISREAGYIDIFFSMIESKSSLPRWL